MNELPPSKQARHISLNRLSQVALAVLVLFSGWIIWKFGGFDLMVTVDIDGVRQSIPNTFSTVDHPFHATRADTLLKSLQDGHILRWVANHQGGYPVEFYPLGSAWLDVALWATLAGTFPIVAVHKLAVLLVFVMPAIGFWILARGDRLSPFVPVLALAIHVAMPGLWTSGGMLELIEWGLVANVGGATLAFIAFAALSRYAAEGNRLFGVLAILASSASLYTNTRAGIAVGVAALAIVLAAAIGRHYVLEGANQTSLKVTVGRIALVGALSTLLTAPLLLAMLRYADYYYFVNYNEYLSVHEFWDASLASISRPFFWLAIVGVGLAFVARRLPLLRMVAVAALMYAGLTVLLSQGGLDQGFIQQLETPRLMPFQRLLAIYLAAAAIGFLLDQVAHRLLPRFRYPLVAAVLALCTVWTVASFDGVFGKIPEQDLMAPAESQTTGQLEFSQFTAIVAEANELRPDGTAIYVVGDQQSWWHEQLWGPTQSDAQFFYDDWMWYWQPEVTEPCNSNAGHFTPNPARTFTDDWLRANGIGVLVVTNMADPCTDPDPRHAAQSNPLLEFQQTIGYWDLYLVKEPGSLVTNGDVQPESVTVENGTITAAFESASGQVEVRHNWFPRWKAYADGKKVHVEQADSGYMLLDVPEGTQQVELRYAVTWADWLGRIAAVVGVAMTIGIAIGIPGPGRRRVRPHAADRPAGDFIELQRG